MSDKKSDFRITLEKWIPSKDVCAYMKQQGRILTDFEKATLIYNHSGMDYGEKTTYLKKLLENTEDMELKVQMQERFENDPKNMLLQCAQSLLKGYGGLNDFQVACEEYCRKKRGVQK